VLYVVAGYPASGKTTALLLSARKGVALFPPPFDRDFRASLPEKVMGQFDPTDEKLRGRMWLHYVDEAAFAVTEAKPEHAVYHMDLLLHLLNDIEPQAMSDFTDEAIRRSFEAFFSGPFCSDYPERAVCTLYPEFLILRSRWGARMGEIEGTTNPTIQHKDQMILGNRGRELYRRVMGIWLEVAGAASTGSWLLRGGKNGNGLPYRQVAFAE